MPKKATSKAAKKRLARLKEGYPTSDGRTTKEPPKTSAKGTKKKTLSPFAERRATEQKSGMSRKDK